MFWLWDPLAEPLNYVQVFYDKDGDFNIMQSIHPATVHECENCGNHCGGDDVVSSKDKCVKCRHLSSDKKHIRRQKLKITGMRKCQYTPYEKRIDITLTDDFSFYQSTVKESDPLYMIVRDLTIGDYHISGIVSDNYIIKISEISPQLLCRSASC